MILLQILVDISQGKYDASSVKDKQQLARVASVVKELFFLSHLWVHDSDYVTCDKAAVDIRSAVKESLDHASKLTYEDREKFIEQAEIKISILQGCRNLLEAALSCARMDQEIDENIERVRAESERAGAAAERERVLLEEERAEYALNEARRRVWDKRHREYMESGDDYGERERVFRKRAREGDADAFAYIAEREEFLWEESGLSRDAYRKRHKILEDHRDFGPILFE